MQNNTMAKGMTDETAQQMTAYLEVRLCYVLRIL